MLKLIIDLVMGKIFLLLNEILSKSRWDEQKHAYKIHTSAQNSNCFRSMEEILDQGYYIQTDQ